MPQFVETIPVAEMAKTPSNGLSAADKALRDQYESFIEGVDDGEAGVLVLTPEEAATKETRRGVKMRLRYASKRLNRNIVKMVDNADEIQYEMGAAKEKVTA